MSIFILEDDIMQAQSMKQIVENICAQQQIPHDFIEVTSRYDDIIEKIPFTSHIPIYFLDIEIKNEDTKGLEVAQEIRKVDQQGIIVFVTTHSELAPISYQYMVSALTFIDKGLPFEKRLILIEQCMKHYVMKNEQELIEDYFMIENVHTTVRVPFSTVEYIMTDEPHRLKLITTNQFIQFYGTLKEIEQMDKRLVRCHQSYIVNQLQLKAYDAKKKMLELESGKTIPVSRRLIGKIKSLLKGDH